MNLRFGLWLGLGEGWELYKSPSMLLPIRVNEFEVWLWLGGGRGYVKRGDISTHSTEGGDGERGGGGGGGGG